MPRAPAMPYMDAFLPGPGAANVPSPFGRDLHWGYWERPEAADGSYDDFADAAAVMTRLVCEAAGIDDGMRVLDVGCGIGGTLAGIDARHSAMDLVGLNIDPRQLAIAREEVVAGDGNEITFVHGDACSLPFPDGSFDAVLAVECIFHFKSRSRFLSEAHRVLRPGRSLAVSDFVPFAPTMLALLPLSWSVPFYGDRNPILQTMTTYRLLARRCGFRISAARDVTRNTIPTYSVMDTYLREVSPEARRQARTIARAARRGLLRYKILTFRSH